MKLFHEDNSRLRYLTREEYDRLIEAVRAMKVRANKPSPYLEEKIVLATHTGLRRGSLFDLRWDQIDFANGVMRIPRTKNGRPLSVPFNATAKGHAPRVVDGTRAREPVCVSASARHEDGRTSPRYQERLPRRPGNWPVSRTSPGTISGTHSRRG